MQSLTWLWCTLTALCFLQLFLPFPLLTLTLVVLVAHSLGEICADATQGKKQCYLYRWFLFNYWLRLLKSEVSNSVAVWQTKPGETWSRDRDGESGWLSFNTAVRPCELRPGGSCRETSLPRDGCQQLRCCLIYQEGKTWTCQSWCSDQPTVSSEHPRLKLQSLLINSNYFLSWSLKHLISVAQHWMIFSGVTLRELICFALWAAIWFCCVL